MGYYSYLAPMGEFVISDPYAALAGIEADRKAAEEKYPNSTWMWPPKIETIQGLKDFLSDSWHFGEWDFPQEEGRPDVWAEWEHGENAKLRDEIALLDAMAPGVRDGSGYQFDGEDGEDNGRAYYKGGEVRTGYANLPTIDDLFPPDPEPAPPNPLIGQEAVGIDGVTALLEQALEQLGLVLVIDPRGQRSVDGGAA